MQTRIFAFEITLLQWWLQASSQNPTPPAAFTPRAHSPTPLSFETRKFHPSRNPRGETSYHLCVAGKGKGKGCCGEDADADKIKDDLSGVHLLEMSRCPTDM